ncbi:MAG: DUF885 domain-containing protein [Cytophagales bacterium]
MKKISLLVLSIILILLGCNDVRKKKVKTSSEEIKKANVFFDRVFDEAIDRSPISQSYLGIKKDYDKWDDISSENEIKEYEILKKELAFLKTNVKYDLLDEATKLSYQLFEYNSNLKIDGYQWRMYNYPINQMFGWHAEIPAFLINIHAISDSTDAKAYILRIKNAGKFIDQVIVGLKERELAGIVAPKFVFPMVIEDCKNLLVGKPFEPKSTENSTILADFIIKVNALNISDNSKNILIKQAEYQLLATLKPAYLALVNTLVDLESKADTSDGVWKFPRGNDFYTYALKSQTTTNMSPDEIFNLGTSEVARIQNEMRTIMLKVNYKNDSLQSFFKFMKTDSQFYLPNNQLGRDQYLKSATALIDTMKTKLDLLFITKPKAKMYVKAVEPFREKSAGTAFYQDPAPDGSRPGTYYVNLYDMKAMPTYEMEALAYHEGIPGHHMQLAIAQELENTPKFRKFNTTYTAYVEGWGLYSEQIPKEIGLYQNPYSDFGRLSMELWRACRLVVDAGIHHKKWTRKQAIQYLKDNTPASDRECRKSIERYIVMPGQATAYKIGMIKILTLRELAMKKMGNNFDIREFHDVVLKNGALPLDVLEKLVNDYVAMKK